jgi:hypothetical protein
VAQLVALQPACVHKGLAAARVLAHKGLLAVAVHVAPQAAQGGKHLQAAAGRQGSRRE